MSDYLKDRIVRIRCRKAYPGAHTHILIGKVEEENAKYLAVKGRTFHFARIVDGMRNQVHAGEVAVRAVPWENIEIIHRLGEKTDYSCEFSFDELGNLVLKDKPRTIIAEKREGME